MMSYAVRTRSPVTSRAAVVYAHKNETIDVITSKGLVSGHLFPQGLNGEPGGVRLLGLLREKESAYRGSPSVEPEGIRS